MIFIGPLGGGNIPKNGASIKNFYIVNYLKSHKKNLMTLDTENWKKQPLLLIKILVTLILRRKAQYIISTNSASAYKVLILLKFLKIKNVLYWVIGGSLADNIENGKYQIEAYKNIRQIIVEGDNMRKKMHKLGLKNVITVPNFKSITYIPRKSYSSTKTKFVFLSRIIPQKGCSYIIDVVKTLSDMGYNNRFQVDFYGPIDNGYKQLFEESIKDINNINYNGFLDLRNIKNYDVLSNYDVMLFPTYWAGEGFPGIAIDALIAGLPIIATDWNMNSEIIKNNQSGFLIPPHDKSALAEAMIKCIENKETVNNMSRYCQNNCMSYDINNVLDEKLYNSFIKI